MVFCGLCDNKAKDARFFRLPATFSTRKAWLKLATVPPNEYMQDLRVCDRHFDETDLIYSSRVTKLGKRLTMVRDGVVPHLNLPASKTESNAGGLIFKNDEIDIHHLDTSGIEDINDDAQIISENILKALAQNQVPDNAIINNDVINKRRNKLTLNNKLKLKRREYIMRLRKQLSNSKKMLKAETAKRMRLMERLATIFTPGEMRVLTSQKEQQTCLHSGQDMPSAVEKYVKGPKLYQYLRDRGFPFPSVSTLRYWTNRLRQTFRDN